MTRPLLSVIIPTRNRAALVGEAIDSALAQDPEKVEVIVVDDGSTDETARLLQQTYGSRIHLLSLPERRGAGAARNAGIRVASGEFLAFLDDDDLWLPGKLAAELSVFERFPASEVVVSDSVVFVQGQIAGKSFLDRNGVLTATRGEASWANDCNWLWTNSLNGVAICSITMRASVLTRIKEPWFAEDLVSCEDWELEMRIYHSCRVAVLPRVLAWVRRLDDGVRVGRTPPGKPPTRDEQMAMLRDRLKVMERSHWLRGLGTELAAELERFRDDTKRQLTLMGAPEQ